MMQMLPLYGVVLGVLAGMVGLGYGLSRRRRRKPAEAGGSFVIDPRLEALLQELRTVLEDGRAEIARLREDSSGSAHDTVMVTVRLAGAALDAEARLAASVAQAEQALAEP